MNVDGIALAVDCSSLPPNIHVIQWNGDRGWIEFIDEDMTDGQRDPNQPIADLSPYQNIIDAWNKAKAKAGIAD